MQTLASPLLVVLVLIAIVNCVYHIDDEHAPCRQREHYFDEHTGECEPCTKCSDSQYVRHVCTAFKDTVCRECENVPNELWNPDYYRKCHWKHRYSFLDGLRKRFLTFPQRNNVIDSDEENTMEQRLIYGHRSDLHHLPPLPTEDYEDEYSDEKQDVLTAENELQQINTVDDHVLSSELEHERNFDENLSKVNKEEDEGLLKPVNVNEDKLDEDEFEELNDILTNSDKRISIVAISVRDKGDSTNSMKSYWSPPTYVFSCHVVGVVLYVTCFVLILAIAIKRCTRNPKHVPVMVFTDEQRKMMHRCAQLLPNNHKEAAVYDNDAVFV